MAVGLATFLLLATLLIPAFLAARTTARRNQSANNLRNLLISVHAFQTASRRLPPGGVVREQGTGVRSWFVSIMPFVELSPLYERIVRYNAPWDDPVLRQYGTEIPPDGRDVRTYVDAFGDWPRPSVLEAFRGAIAMAPGTTHLTLPFVSSECREGLTSLSRLRVLITDAVEDESAIELISKNLKTLVLRRSADPDLEKSLRTDYPDLEILWRPAK